MRRISVAIAVLPALVFATPVLAAPGCGTGHDLMSVDATVAVIDDRIYTSSEFAELTALIEAQDKNSDDLLCTKQFKPNQGQDKQWIGPEDGDIGDYVITLIQDNNAAGRGA